MSTSDGSINSNSSFAHGYKFTLRSRILQRKTNFIVRSNITEYLTVFQLPRCFLSVRSSPFLWLRLDGLNNHASSIIYTQIKVSLCPLSFRRVQRITARAISFKSTCHLREFAIILFSIDCKISCEVNILLPAQLCRM